MTPANPPLEPVPNDATRPISSCSRRQFVSLLTATIATASPLVRRAMAGPFSAADFQKLIPVDKKLSADWVKSLFERGQPSVYSGADLRYIGMPVGGITCGQVYLGGDGRLWHWDIFNRSPSTGDGNYAHPVDPHFPFDQGFSLTVHGQEPQVRELDASGFGKVSFCGQYPIGTVSYEDEACPIRVQLDAFSPFIPLNVDDSSLPATILSFTLTNHGDSEQKLSLSGRLENAVGLITGPSLAGTRRNAILRDDHATLLNCDALPPKEEASSRPPIVFEDFEKPDFAPWTVEGDAFGKAPSHGPPTPVQRLSGFLGKGLANSWTLGSDEPQGKLTSPSFTISRRFINFLIGGGDHPKQTCINLIVAGNIERTATGHNSDQMLWASWNVEGLEGKTAVLEIVDHHSGDWGHIDIDQIEFADVSRQSVNFADAPDVGTMALALLEPQASDLALPALHAGPGDTQASAPMRQKLVGSLTRSLTLAPGQSATVSFVLAWHFPNLKLDRVIGGTGRHYANRFKSAGEVAHYVADNFERLSSTTRLWRDTWYDSTLPHWFLDRTLLNASILATSTAYRFANGRFYGWEGVGCCEGTCTHVWHYGQAMGRLFPELERLLREKADFHPEVGMRPDGMIDHRGEFKAGQAVDGQAGIILRAYRDHQTSADDAFLRRNWPSIRKATEWLIAQDALDGQDDGILQGAQHNTLDAEWYGPVAWLSGLYLAALRASEEMARELGDADFAQQCRRIFDVGQGKFVKTLFNGEYFINKPDPKHPEAINSGSGCEIDQVFGQSWAFQVGLGRVLPTDPTRSALRALWKYNFAPDVGPYRNVNRPGRWYAMPGEAGLLMCSFPQADWQYEQARGKGPEWATGYFNECMNGFEHQVAGHMVCEGMVQEGLAVERAIHDRYHPSRRNPWNEVECGDHYARSMASYGVFLAACGFAHHGPKGELAFSPRLTPEHFRCAFTTAEGWGSYEQKIEGGSLSAIVTLKYGKLSLKQLTLGFAGAPKDLKIEAAVDGKKLDAKVVPIEDNINITFGDGVVIATGTALTISVRSAP